MVLGVYGARNDQVTCSARLGMFVRTRLVCVLGSRLDLVYLRVIINS